MIHNSPFWDSCLVASSVAIQGCKLEIARFEGSSCMLIDEPVLLKLLGALLLDTCLQLACVAGVRRGKEGRTGGKMRRSREEEGRDLLIFPPVLPSFPLRTPATQANLQWAYRRTLVAFSDHPSWSYRQKCPFFYQIYALEQFPLVAV